MMKVEVPGRSTKLGQIWRKYMRLTRGGVSVLRALDVMCLEEEDPFYGRLLQGMRESMEEGMPLSEFMENVPELFSLSAIELVRMAERHGRWDEALTELSDGLLDGTFD